MITNQDLQDGRMRIMSGDEYAASVPLYLGDRGRVQRMDFVLTGGIITSNKIQVPHPGFTDYGDDDAQENGVATLLRWDQAEHLALELLKALNGGAMPDNSAELVDFISGLGR